MNTYNMFFFHGEVRYLMFWILLELHHETCLYNYHPLKSDFYIVKLGFTGIYIIFLISALKHRLWVLF